MPETLYTPQEAMLGELETDPSRWVRDAERYVDQHGEVTLEQIQALADSYIEQFDVGDRKFWKSGGRDLLEWSRGKGGDVYPTELEGEQSKRFLPRDFASVVDIILSHLPDRSEVGVSGNKPISG